MINFEELNIIDAPTITKESILPQNYVIGADPFDQEEGSKHSVFCVFEKSVGRVTLRMKTTRTFEKFIEFVQKNDLVKNHIISRKFINDDGRAKKVSEIRS